MGGGVIWVASRLMAVASVSYPVKVPLPLENGNGNGHVDTAGGERGKEEKEAKVKMETRWISPLVDASKPDMRTRANRMGRDEKEN